MLRFLVSCAFIASLQILSLGRAWRGVHIPNVNAVRSNHSILGERCMVAALQYFRFPLRNVSRFGSSVGQCVARTESNARSIRWPASASCVSSAMANAASRYSSILSRSCCVRSGSIGIAQVSRRDVSHVAPGNVLGLAEPQHSVLERPLVASYARRLPSSASAIESSIDPSPWKSRPSSQTSSRARS